MLLMGSIFLAITLATPQGMQEYAAKHVEPYEVRCMVKLWTKESNWRYKAKSPTHDYGIPQRHMKGKSQRQIDKFLASPLHQIHWGIGYVRHRYGDFCSALDFHKRHNWY